MSSRLKRSDLEDTPGARWVLRSVLFCFAAECIWNLAWPPRPSLYPIWALVLMLGGSTLCWALLEWKAWRTKR